MNHNIPIGAEYFYMASSLGSRKSVKSRYLTYSIDLFFADTFNQSFSYRNECPIRESDLLLLLYTQGITLETRVRYMKKHLPQNRHYRVLKYITKPWGFRLNWIQMVGWAMWCLQAYQELWFSHVWLFFWAFS